MNALSSARRTGSTERGRLVSLAPVAQDPDQDAQRFEIRRATDGVLVGAVEISRIARGNFQSGYLGYSILPAYRRRGYMTEALQLVLRHAFRTLRLHRIEANVEPGNEASLALVRSAGFIREGFSRRYLKIGGRWRDHERWALLAEDWRPSKRSGSRSVPDRPGRGRAGA